MVGSSSNALRESLQAVDRSAKVLEQSLSPVVGNEWSTLLSGEDQVIMEAEEGRTH